MLIGFSVFCQNNEYEFTRYFYPNGNISAEGYIREGKPDGYWKNYYEDGTLKSEGNRLFFELDSIWNFYYPDGLIENSINYRKDKKMATPFTTSIFMTKILLNIITCFQKNFF